MSRFEDFVNRKMDAFASSKIEAAIKKSENAHVEYDTTQLDQKVNPEETLREYINDGIKEFGLTPVNLDDLSKKDLNILLKRIDELWGAAIMKG